MIKRTLCNIINFVCSFVLMTLFFTTKNYFYYDAFVFISVLMTCVISLSGLFLIKNNKIKTFKIIFVFHVLYVLIVVFFHVLKMNNLLYIFSSVATFKHFILSTKGLGVIIYILIQMAQIIILPIPASIIAIAGAIIYGPLIGSIFCTVGVLLGSYISFFIGRTLGYRLVCWVVGRDNAEKYADVLKDSGKIFLCAAFLLPMFPDDILCLIAGLTNMKFSTFFIIATIFRPIGVICMCFFGSGSVIPFTGWGIPLWIIIGVLMAIAIILSCKYKENIERWAINKFSKHHKKRQL